MTSRLLTLCALTLLLKTGCAAVSEIEYKTDISSTTSTLSRIVEDRELVKKEAAIMLRKAKAENNKQLEQLINKWADPGKEVIDFFFEPAFYGVKDDFKSSGMDFVQLIEKLYNNSRKIADSSFLIQLTQLKYDEMRRGVKEFCLKTDVLREYRTFMTDYFKNSEHSHYKGTFGDILLELKKRIGDEGVDVKKYLLAAIPTYKGYVKADKVPIQRPSRMKKKKEEKK